MFIHIGWIPSPSRTLYSALSRQGYTLCTNCTSFSKSSLLSSVFSGCMPAQTRIDRFKFLPNPGTNCERERCIYSMSQWLHLIDINSTNTGASRIPILLCLRAIAAWQWHLRVPFSSLKSRYKHIYPSQKLLRCKSVKQRVFMICFKLNNRRTLPTDVKLEILKVHMHVLNNSMFATDRTSVFAGKLSGPDQ